MDEVIEKEIQAKRLTAPRVTLQSIEDQIVAEYSGVASKLFAGTPAHSSMDLLTICVIVLKNGFTLVGKSACASPENFDAEIGHKLARADAVQQIWALEGYALRNKLAA